VRFGVNEDHPGVVDADKILHAPGPMPMLQLSCKQRASKKARLALAWSIKAWSAFGAVVETDRSQKLVLDRGPFSA